MTVGEIKDVVMALVGAEKKNDILAAEQYNLYLQKANLDLFNQALQGWEMGQPITDMLAPFKDKTDLTFSGGTADYPADYARGSSAYYENGGTTVPVEILTDAELPDRIDNAITPPSASYPVITFYNNEINILPSDITTGVDLLYVKYPTTPVYEEKIENDINVYDSGSSTELDWGNRYHPDIVRLIVGYLGIDVKNQTIIQAIKEEKSQNVKI